MRVRGATRVIVVWSLVALFVGATAIPGSANVDTVVCNGDTLSGDYADVIVKRKGCTLDGASVAGSVLAEGARRTVTVIDSTVLGGVQLKDSRDLVLVGAVISGEVSVETSRRVTVDGGTLAGGLKVTESRGDVVVSGDVPASIIVEKGRGDVVVSGGGERFTGEDLGVIEQSGDVSVTRADLSDVTIEKVDGSILLDDVTTDSDTKLVLNLDVTISNSSLGSDVAIIENLTVTVTDNDFSLEDVKIEKNTGPVLVDGNRDFSLGIVENDDVTISGNVFTDADVSKNSGGTSIVGNIGEVLSCSDNSPAPTGSGNVISELTDGQCAGF